MVPWGRVLLGRHGRNTTPRRAPTGIYVLGFTNRVTLTLALSAAACLGAARTPPTPPPPPSCTEPAWSCGPQGADSRAPPLFPQLTVSSQSIKKRPLLNCRVVQVREWVRPRAALPIIRAFLGSVQRMMVEHHPDSIIPSHIRTPSPKRTSPPSSPFGSAPQPPWGSRTSSRRSSGISAPSVR